MKFIIKRTSDWYSKPLDGAVKDQVHEFMHVRKSAQDKKPHALDWFFDKYTNVTDIGDDTLRGTRKVATTVYTMEIADLVEFVMQNGRIVLSEPDCKEGYPIVEIYDSYRE